MRHARRLTAAFAAAAVLAAPAAPALAEGGLSSTFDLGLAIESFEYEEPDVMKESGPQAGLFGAWTGFFGPGVMGHAFLSYVGGDIDYDGGLQGRDASGRSFTIPATSSTPNSIFNLRLVAGYRVALGALDVVPFAGFGYRMLSNEIGDVMDLEGYGKQRVSCAGYNRDQSYNYLPLGVQAMTTLGSGWGVEATAEYDVFLSGENHSHRDECGMDNTFKQDSGLGYRASVRVVSPPVFGELRFTVEPYFEHWEVDESDRLRQGDLVWVEPENSATSVGLRLGARY